MSIDNSVQLSIFNLEDCEQLSTTIEQCLNGVDRFYNWSLIVYDDISVYQPLIHKSIHYAYALHDKDVNKCPHYHLLLHFENEISFQKLKNDIKSICSPQQNYFIQPIKDIYRAFEYLIHKNHPQKFQYDSDVRVYDKLSYWVKDKIEHNNVEILDDIVGGMSMYQLAKKYGRDFIINKDKYIAFANLCIGEILSKK